MPTADYRTSGYVAHPVEGFDITKTPIRMKALVCGVGAGDAFRAYPYSLFENSERITDTLGGKTIHLVAEKDKGFLSVTDEDGAPMLYQRMYWIIWKGNHPASDVYGVAAPDEKESDSAAQPTDDGPKSPPQPGSDGK